MDEEKIKREFSDLVGKVLTSIEVDKESNVIIFSTECGKNYVMYHEQDCCESAVIEDICGIPLQDHVGKPIILAEERSDSATNKDDPDAYSSESFTCTFYELATLSGATTIRWYAYSNGYYSERIDFCEILAQHD
jgi:hypothetical protein